MTAKLSRQQKEAIAALVGSPSVEEAALAIGVAVPTLRRWMKNPEFDAQHRAASCAQVRHGLAYIGQGFTSSVKSLVQLVHQAKRPATRLRAARAVIQLVKEGKEIEEFTAAVAQAEGACAGAGLSAARSARSKGHGAKLPGRKEQAIAALLAQRSIPAAARSVDLAVSTLYRWLGEPTFFTAYAAAAIDVFGPAMMLARHYMGDAITLIRSFAVNPAISEETRLQANLYIAGESKSSVRETLAARVAVLEPAPAGVGDSEVSSPTIGRGLHRKLQQVKVLLTKGKSESRKIILLHADEGRPAGSSVKGADGWQVWLDPPEGSSTGDRVAEAA